VEGVAEVLAVLQQLLPALLQTERHLFVCVTNC
jgi:hypothetical protein